MKNRTSEYEFTILVPVYNEEGSIPRLEAAFREYLPKSQKRACVLFINDGSKDGSLGLIREACERNPHFYYISLKRNSGLSAAMKAGIDYTQSEWTGYIDADLQTNPEDFNLLLAETGNHDLVTGIRANRKDTGFKRLQSKIANGWRRKMTGDTAVDTGCPLKVMRSSMVKKLPFFTGMHRFLPALFMLEDGRIAQLPVRHYPRTEGVSKYTLRNRLVGPFMDCFAYRWMKKRYIRYEIGEESKE